MPQAQFDSPINRKGEHSMISKGDLVKLRLTVGGDTKGVSELFILGKMMNYSNEEETFVLEPRAISIRKNQVAEAVRLREDFDFGNISEELSATENGLERTVPPDITNIRVSRSH
jgi:hypothetical protein